VRAREEGRARAVGAWAARPNGPREEENGVAGGGRKVGCALSREGEIKETPFFYYKTSLQNHFKFVLNFGKDHSLQNLNAPA
jgi:hypothetical protein